MRIILICINSAKTKEERGEAMSRSIQNDAAITSQIDAMLRGTATCAVMRIESQELFQQKREIEIKHDGRIYRLRITQLNKLILTA